MDKIRKRRDVKRVYHEKFGPTFLCLGLLAALLVNFILRVKHGDIVPDNNPVVAWAQQQQEDLVSTRHGLEL